MTRSHGAEEKKHPRSLGLRRLTALLLAAISLSAAGANPVQAAPLPSPEKTRNNLGEQVCAAPPLAVPPRARELANQVLEQVYALPDTEKRYLLDKRRDAVGFAIFPNVQRQGFMVSALYGKGILSYRDDVGNWSPPILLTIQGQSMGPLFSMQTSNIIFIFKSVAGIQDFLSGHHHVSTHASGALVEHVGHGADPLSITIHLFDRGSTFGQSTDTYAILIDPEANAALYGMPLQPGCILEGTRSGLKAPWMLRYFETMQLPPGQPHRTLELE